MSGTAGASAFSKLRQLRAGRGAQLRIRRSVALVTLLIGSWSVALAQQRDLRLVPTGTAEISGVVLSADVPAQPVRRAVVSITSGGPPDPRSAVTDDGGRFTFSRLPAGTFTVTARKAAYLETGFGVRRPGRPGSAVVVGEGQRREISLTMFKGAVISGTLRNGSGQPLAGVPVTAVDVRATDSVGLALPQASNAGPFSTDERGAYRVYGLMPGEYAIAALPLTEGRGQPGARSVAEMDALLSTLARGQGAPPPSAATLTMPSRNPFPTAPQAPGTGYAPIYFPGRAVFADATKIRVAAGEQRDSVDFEVSRVPFGSIKGRILGNVPTLARVELAIIPPGPRLPGLGTMGITSTPPNRNGEFAYGNLPPGRHRIVARARPETASAGVGVHRLITPYLGEQFFAVADVDVRGADVTNIVLQFAPGGSVSGRAVFDSASTPVPDDLTAIRVDLAHQGSSGTSTSGTTVVGQTLSVLRPVPLRPDGTFSVVGIGPARYLPTVVLPANMSRVWTLQSAVVSGRDLLDTGIQGPDVQLSDVTLVLTDRPTELAGTLETSSGQPTAEYFVIAFSIDRTTWTVGARRSRSARPDTGGRFAFVNLPAGEYYVAALTDLDPIEWQDASFLEQVAPAAVRISIGIGEKKTQNLRVK